MEQKEQSILEWKDLSVDEVYYIAHVENEMRDNAAALLSKIAFISDRATLKEIYQQAHTIIKDCDKLSNNWISALAVNQGFTSAQRVERKLPSLGKSESSADTSEWVADQLDLAKSRGIPAKDIAKAAGISESYLSGLKNARRGNPSNELVQRLSAAFSELIQESKQTTSSVR